MAVLTAHTIKKNVKRDIREDLKKLLYIPQAQNRSASFNLCSGRVKSDKNIKIKTNKLSKCKNYQNLKIEGCFGGEVNGRRNNDGLLRLFI